MSKCISILFFKDTKKTHIFAKFIQWMERLNFKRSGDDVNHVALSYTDFYNVEMIYEVNLNKGAISTNYTDYVDAYVGEIYLYELDFEIDLKLFYEFMVANMGTDYSSTGAISSFEIRRIWWIYDLFNKMLDKLKIFSSKNDRFCSSSVCEFLQLQLEKLDKKDHPLYKFIQRNGGYNEITPAQLKNYLDKQKYNGRIIKRANIC